MIQSMTGFGRAERSMDHRKICVEVRSVNSKQLDLSLRVPSIYKEQQPQVRNLVSKRAVRGKVEATVTYQNIHSPENLGSINGDLFVERYNELTALLKRVDSPAQEQLVDAVLRMPEVVAEQVVEISEQEFKILEEVVIEALDNFEQFRLTEGHAMITDLLQRIDNIEALSQQIPQYEGQRIETVRARLMENLEKISVNIDNNRFEQELIYYLEKFDITEEKVRLKQHLDYFREVSQGELAGRKLAFITQEIGREINTTGSKANHVEIQKIVVAMKDELEKIKEQLLNIL
ncbi:MAG: YicC/YloC family endoribonuclease [Rikenellaceae bacterium]